MLRERFCKVDLTFQDIDDHVQAESRTYSRAITLRPFGGGVCAVVVLPMAFRAEADS